MKLLIATLLAGFLFSASARKARADIITPVMVRATSEFGAGTGVDRLIDGSGLDGIGPVDAQLHDSTESNMWISGCRNAGLPCGVRSVVQAISSDSEFLGLTSKSYSREPICQWRSLTRIFSVKNGRAVS